MTGEAAPRLNRLAFGYLRGVPKNSARSRTKSATTNGVTERFEFRYEGAVGIAAQAFTATPARAYIEVSDEDLTARFGPWLLTTPLSNIAEIAETGPYKVWKVIGPPRLSFADRGITFATNNDRGVCIRFFEPVPGIEPTGRLRHPGMTVTVADPSGLVAALAAR